MCSPNKTFYLDLVAYYYCSKAFGLFKSFIILLQILRFKTVCNILNQVMFLTQFYIPIDLYPMEKKHHVSCHSIIPLLLHATEKTSQNHLYKTVKIKVLMSSFYYLLFFYAFVFIVCIYVRMCTFTNMYIVAMDLVLICPHWSILSSCNVYFKYIIELLLFQISYSK